MMIDSATADANAVWLKSAVAPPTNATQRMSVAAMVTVTFVVLVPMHVVPFLDVESIDSDLHMVNLRPCHRVDCLHRYLS